MKKLVVLSIAFCTFFFFSSTLYAADGDEILIGYTSDALSMDPANHRERTTETILRDMYDDVYERVNGWYLKYKLKKDGEAAARGDGKAARNDGQTVEPA